MEEYQLKTIRSAVSAFRHFLEDKTGRLHSQPAYPPKLVYFFLNLYRNFLTAQDIKAKGTGDLNTIVTKPCIKFEELDQVECPCAPPSGCTFYKSVFPVPEMIGGKPISVTTVDGSYTYDYVKWQDFRDKLRSFLLPERTQPYYTLKTIDNKQHLYLYSSTKIEEPKLAAIVITPYDSLEAFYTPECDETERPFCNPLDDPFIMSKEIAPEVFRLTLVALMQLTGATPAVDLINNEINDAKAKVQGN